MASLSDSELSGGCQQKVRHKSAFKAKCRQLHHSHHHLHHHNQQSDALKCLRKAADRLVGCSGSGTGTGNSVTSPSSAAEQHRFLLAVMTNNTELVADMLERGAVSANTADMQARSALHLATSRGYTAMVRLLLKHRANPNQQDTLQNTPLHLAACTSSLDLISTLIHGGADVRQLDRHGRNPLQLAESKLRILRRSWLSGAIELVQLRTQLEEIVAMIRLVQQQKKREADASQSDDDTALQRLTRLNIGSSAAEDIDAQMGQLLTELGTVTIKD